MVHPFLDMNQVHSVVYQLHTLRVAESMKPEMIHIALVIENIAVLSESVQRLADASVVWSSANTYAAEAIKQQATRIVLRRNFSFDDYRDGFNHRFHLIRDWDAMCGRPGFRDVAL